MTVPVNPFVVVNVSAVVTVPNDFELHSDLLLECAATEIETWEISASPLDHGAVVPLWFLAEAGWNGLTTVLSPPIQCGPAQLRALGGAKRPESLALVERVLTSPEFDAGELLTVRQMAAWTARRIGGTRMAEALERAVRRRHGRDARILIYAALVSGDSALLREYRRSQLRYVGWKRGLADRRLAWLIREMEAGRPLVAVDRAPERMRF